MDGLDNSDPKVLNNVTYDSKTMNFLNMCWSCGKCRNHTKSTCKECGAETLFCNKHNMKVTDKFFCSDFDNVDDMRIREPFVPNYPLYPDQIDPNRVWFLNLKTSDNTRRENQ